MNKPLHRITLAVAAAHLLAVALVVFWPTPVDRQGAGALREALSWLHGHGMPRIINYSVVEFSANIVMFVPMGFFASSYFKNARVGIVVGALASCLIELAQALLLTERFATGLDVLANTMGAGLGAWLYYLLKPRQGGLPLVFPSEPQEPNTSRDVVYATPHGAK